MKTKKRFLSILLGLVMVLGLMIGMSLTAYASEVGHTHNGITFNAWESDASLPTGSGYYYLTQDVTISSSWMPDGGATINLCLNGYGIRYSGSNGSVIHLYNNETKLNLYDCDTARKHYITLTDGRGTAVSDTSTGGAIEVSGGYITGGNTWYTSREAGRGGGVFIDSSSSEFNMYGGTIIGNKSERGGGVYVSSMSTCTMSGGSITKNTAINGSYNKGEGGGVCVEGTFIMTGGRITGNTAITGGGVSTIEYHPTFTMSGGSITGNTASQNGGGVYLNKQNVEMELSGSPTITGNTKGDAANNVYMGDGSKIRVKNALADTTSVGVTLAGGTGEFASGEPVGAAYTAYFTSDNAAYYVEYDGGFGLELKTHTHSFTYTASGATITATCCAEGCTLSPSTEGGTDHVATLTVAAPTLEYVGQTGESISASATLDGLDVFNSATGLNIAATDIKYVGRDGTTYEESTTAPTVGGKYTAKLALTDVKTGADTTGDVTASVDYSIKVTLTFDSNGGSNVDQQVLDVDEDPTVPDNPTNGSNYFGGWYTNANFEQKYNFYPITQNTTVYAKWGEHTVQWVITGDYLGTYTDVFTGNAPAANSNDSANSIVGMTTPEGSTFAGWKTETDASGNVTYTTQFTYPVTLHTNEGTVNEGNLTTYVYRTGATLPTDVTMGGYDFGGWFDNSSLTGTAVTQISATDKGAKEYWAKWTAIPATMPIISEQPRNLTLTYGYTEGSLSVTAMAATDTTYNDLTYQWYSNTTNSSEGGTAIDGETGVSYTIPTGKYPGTTEYYYCVITATRTDNDQTATVASNVAVVTVKGVTSYTLTIPATLNVSTPGWNATDGITVAVSSGGIFDSGKKVSVTASSENSWSLKSGENSISYSLMTASTDTEPTLIWTFTANELNASGGTNKPMGIIVEDYSEKPVGTYQDAVTFTAKVEEATE